MKNIGREIAFMGNSIAESIVYFFIILNLIRRLLFKSKNLQKKNPEKNSRRPISNVSHIKFNFLRICYILTDNNNIK